MTAQRNDIFFFDNGEYSLVGASNSFGISPMQYGITPRHIETSCWRGYWNEYGLQNSQVVLKNIYVNSSRNGYPKIAGKRPLLFFRKDGYHKYANINITLEYTGKLLIARKYLWKYRHDMGIDEPWEYEELIKLDFKNGILCSVTNCNNIARRTREYLTDNPRKRYLLFKYKFLKQLYDSG